MFSGISGNLFEWMYPFIHQIESNHQIYIIQRQNQPKFPNAKIITQDLIYPFELNIPIDLAIYGAFILPYNIEINESKYYEINRRMLQNFLTSLKKKPHKIIYISTHAINETIYDKNKLMYAKAKFEGEQVILDYCQQNNISCVILRLPPLVSKIEDFVYENEKLKSFFVLFPLSKKHKVVFISQKSTFLEIMNDAVFSEQQSSRIISFDFKKPLNFQQKISFLKSKLHKQQTKIIVYFPLKSGTKMNGIHNRFNIKYEKHMLNLSKEINF